MVRSKPQQQKRRAGEGGKVHQGRRCFRLTPEGHSIWRMRGSVPLPLDYRRILGLVEYAGHAEVIHSRLARLPADEVDQLLVEFESIQLIEPVAAHEPRLEDLARSAAPPPIEPEDQAAYENDSSYVDTSLSRLGVYVATDRIARRAPSTARRHDLVVLHVEDDPDQRALAARRLNADGYPVRSVDGVRACYQFLEQTMPDALFLDINMPDGEGFEVLSVLRRHPAFTFLPIVMLTARDAREDIVQGLALGADGYVTKNYRPNTLDYVLRYVLQQEAETAPAARTKGTHAALPL
jgi:CheY-like chemotaxis protein